MIAFSMDERKILLKELLAKGGAFVVLVCWIIYLSYQNSALSVKLDKLETQLYQLQNSIIIENTRALHEFNLKMDNKQ